MTKLSPEGEAVARRIYAALGLLSEGMTLSNEMKNIVLEQTNEDYDAEAMAQRVLELEHFIRNGFQDHIENVLRSCYRQSQKNSASYRAADLETWIRRQRVKRSERLRLQRRREMLAVRSEAKGA